LPMTTTGRSKLATAGPGGAAISAQNKSPRAVPPSNLAAKPN